MVNKKPIKRKSRTTEAKLKEKLWETCKKLTRSRYQNKDGTWNCFTCGRLIDEPAKAQTGHFIPSSTCGAFLRYDLRNLRIQDYFCNINLGGNGSVFYQCLLEEEGEEYIAQLFRDKHKVIKADRVWLEKKIAEHELLITQLP